LQPYWKDWVGIEKIVNWISAAGDGKSPLDGMFGRMNAVLSSAIDSGYSYFDSASTLSAIEASGGLSATSLFLEFKAQRTRCLFATFPEDVSLASVLRTKLNAVIIHQRRGYLGEWANADKIDLLVLLLNFRIVRRKVKLLEIDALGRSDGVDKHLTSDTLP
jgi:hypothetical protein